MKEPNEVNGTEALRRIAKSSIQTVKYISVKEIQLGLRGFNGYHFKRCKRNAKKEENSKGA